MIGSVSSASLTTLFQSTNSSTSQSAAQVEAQIAEKQSELATAKSDAEKNGIQQQIDALNQELQALQSQQQASSSSSSPPDNSAAARQALFDNDPDASSSFSITI